MCPKNNDGTEQVALDKDSHLKLDVNYFKNVRDENGVLESDTMEIYLLCLAGLLLYRFSIKDSIRYMFQEQRLLFLLVGIAIAALISNVVAFPSMSPLQISEQVSGSFHIAELTSVPRRIAYELPSGHVNAVTLQIFDWDRDHKTNVVGTLNMLGLAKRINARFLLTSTSEVYGDPLEHPQVETYWGNVNPIGVRSCYDEGKRVAETLTMDYHRGLNIEVRIARIFNTYGPRMCLDDGRVVSNFVAQTLRMEPMTVYGDGKQTRSFQYVSDLVDGLMRLMEGEHVGPFNLGNPGEFTMLELAKVVQDTIDPNAKIEFRPNTEDDPHKRKPDISRARELLGWQPMVPLQEGLPMMVSDFRQRIFSDLKEGGSHTSTYSSV
ncbi:hypothetical protein L1987_41523 [Smallanthus sonchifolius]|uniref:Uncharacterized protein n=1 Tax=Smallanthus sonchifolius TaxID=185202 RepID=A0ACB9GVG9_9ASTR|nr:hypothetical protein L1987_41523 [Smallanthus sonchifolius]